MKRLLSTTEKSCEEEGADLNQGITLDINQTPGHKHFNDLVPGLLRGSVLWNTKAQRLALPTEHLEMQGIAVHVPAEFPFKCPWHAIMPALSDAVLKKVAGNAMAAMLLRSHHARIYTYIWEEPQR